MYEKTSSFWLAVSLYLFVVCCRTSSTCTWKVRAMDAVLVRKRSQPSVSRAICPTNPTGATTSISNQADQLRYGIVTSFQMDTSLSRKFEVTKIKLSFFCLFVYFVCFCFVCLFFRLFSSSTCLTLTLPKHPWFIFSWRFRIQKILFVATICSDE